MSSRLTAFLAWIRGKQYPAAQLASARRRAAWQQIEFTMTDLRRAA